MNFRTLFVTLVVIVVGGVLLCWFDPNLGPLNAVKDPICRICRMFGMPKAASVVTEAAEAPAAEAPEATEPTAQADQPAVEENQQANDAVASIDDAAAKVVADEQKLAEASGEQAAA